MPITIATAAHPPRKWKGSKASTAEDLLERASPKDYRRSQNIIQSSFPRSLFRQSLISPTNNGLVWSVFHAYSDHHNLTLRPEDIWFSILTQLSFFVNAHAEELRSFFVAHDGQKQLEVGGAGSIDNTNFGALAVRMTELIQKNVIDEDLRDWIMPSFTTTTESDNVVAAILMMGALQKYFTYRMKLDCGIPSVTLLGEKEDWLSIVKKIEKLKQLGDEPARFAQLLRPVLNHLVLCFENPDSPEVLDFWSRCAHKHSMMSGSDYLCGWISVFCFWDEDGKRLYRDQIYPVSSDDFERRNTDLSLEDALARRIDIDKIPSAYTSVPVIVDDNGDVCEAMMLAGLVGIQVTSSGAIVDQGTGQGGDQNERRRSSVCNIFRSGEGSREDTGPDSIQPLSGWWMYEKQQTEDTEGESGEAHLETANGSQDVGDILPDNGSTELETCSRVQNLVVDGRSSVVSQG
ncbi:hypothetical protein N7475_006878 [Penicillium sp. IBT 31633x]|nr:hypothetical protein N7475_006878 [Penicillium sp. IBT 31633x]